MLLQAAQLAYDLAMAESESLQRKYNLIRAALQLCEQAAASSTRDSSDTLRQRLAILARLCECQFRLYHCDDFEVC